MYAKFGKKPTEDQIQDAREFMCKAAHKFNPRMGVPFMSYAAFWIWSSVSNNIYKYRKNGTAYRACVYRSLPDQRLVRGGDSISNLGAANKEMGLKKSAVRSEIGAELSFEDLDLIERALAMMPERFADSVIRNALYGESFTDIEKEWGGVCSRYIPATLDRIRKKILEKYPEGKDIVRENF